MPRLVSWVPRLVSWVPRLVSLEGVVDFLNMTLLQCPRMAKLGLNGLFRWNPCSPPYAPAIVRTGILTTYYTTVHLQLPMIVTSHAGLREGEGEREEARISRIGRCCSSDNQAIWHLPLQLEGMIALITLRNSPMGTGCCAITH